MSVAELAHQALERIPKLSKTAEQLFKWGRCERAGRFWVGSNPQQQSVSMFGVLYICMASVACSDPRSVENALLGG